MHLPFCKYGFPIVSNEVRHYRVASIPNEPARLRSLGSWLLWFVFFRYFLFFKLNHELITTLLLDFIVSVSKRHYHSSADLA